MSVWIARLGKSETVGFAAEELRKYLKQMDPLADIAILCADKYDKKRTDTLWVGLDAAFDTLLPDVEDRQADDGIYLEVSHSTGIVTGTNERSVLQAVYRLLRGNGCAFLNPCQNGERIPRQAAESLCAHVCEKADSRHRGVCIEGASSYEHVRNMIDFLPKIGMNSYFIQFFTPQVFFDRWYKHMENPTLPGKAITRDEVMGMKTALISEIRKRGLAYHAIGHGWTCEPLGIAGESWERDSGNDIPEDLRELLAEVNGKRELWGGIALNTNLCYGNPAVRERITQAIADYCEKNPEVDYLHFWLADGTNNHCECPLCRDTLPSDFYVKMLNELDEKMTARGLTTHIVFLVYVDLLWEPQTEKIRHPERFVLMFAPITRTYSASFRADTKADCTLAAYRRNNNQMPKTVTENVARLQKWQEIFDGDSFDFDYHFMWDHWLDLGYYRMAQVLMEDMQNLDKIGLNGMISCQNQRVFFPTALGMHAMAAGLWDHNASFDALADAYFATAYGKDGSEVRKYLAEVSRLYDPPYLRGEKKKIDPEQAAGYVSLKKLAEDFLPVIETHIATENDAAIRNEWNMLTLHNELVRRMADMLAEYASGHMQNAKDAWEKVLSYIRGIEPAVNERFDLMEFVSNYRKRVFGPGEVI